MAISVDIADRLYDYTDEEKAADAVAGFQATLGLDDRAIIDIWASRTDGRRMKLEAMILAAVDANGSVKRAKESVPADIRLEIATDEAI